MEHPRYEVWGLSTRQVRGQTIVFLGHWGDYDLWAIPHTYNIEFNGFKADYPANPFEHFGMVVMVGDLRTINPPIDGVKEAIKRYLER